MVSSHLTSKNRVPPVRLLNMTCLVSLRGSRGGGGGALALALALALASTGGDTLKWAITCWTAQQTAVQNTRVAGRMQRHEPPRRTKHRQVPRWVPRLQLRGPNDNACRRINPWVRKQRIGDAQYRGIVREAHWDRYNHGDLLSRTHVQLHRVSLDRSPNSFIDRICLLELLDLAAWVNPEAREHEGDTAQAWAPWSRSRVITLLRRNTVQQQCTTCVVMVKRTPNVMVVRRTSLNSTGLLSCSFLLFLAVARAETQQPVWHGKQ